MFSSDIIEKMLYLQNNIMQPNKNYCQPNQLIINNRKDLKITQKNILKWCSKY